MAATEEEGRGVQLPLALDAPQGKPLRGCLRHPCPASASRSPGRIEAR